MHLPVQLMLILEQAEKVLEQVICNVIIFLIPNFGIIHQMFNDQLVFVFTKIQMFFFHFLLWNIPKVRPIPAVSENQMIEKWKWAIENRCYGIEFSFYPKYHFIFGSYYHTNNILNIWNIFQTNLWFSVRGFSYFSLGDSVFNLTFIARILSSSIGLSWFIL